MSEGTRTGSLLSLRRPRPYPREVYRCNGVLDMMNAGAPYPTPQWAVPIHPTVSELIPTVLGDLKPVH